MGPLQTLSLEAVVVEGAEPLTNVTYLVQRMDADSQEDMRARSVNGLAVFSLPSGHYKVTATFGDTKRQQQVIIGDQPAHHVMNLEAGTVRMKAIPKPGGRPFNVDVTWEILTYGRDSTGKRHSIATSKQGQPSFTLPEGYYVATVAAEGKQIKHTIEVTSGITYKYTLLLR